MARLNSLAMLLIDPTVRYRREGWPGPTSTLSGWHMEPAFVVHLKSPHWNSVPVSGSPDGLGSSACRLLRIEALLANLPKSISALWTVCRELPMGSSKIGWGKGFSDSDQGKDLLDAETGVEETSLL